jgi:hypothetical protein
VKEQRDLAVGRAGFEVRHLQRIGADASYGLEPCQSYLPVVRCIAARA